MKEEFSTKKGTYFSLEVDERKIKGINICEVSPVSPATSDEKCGPDCKFRLKFVITRAKEGEDQKPRLRVFAKDSKLKEFYSASPSPCKHSSLVQCKGEDRTEDVLVSGEMQVMFIDGKCVVTKINNESGHYPSSTDTFKENLTKYLISSGESLESEHKIPLNEKKEASDKKAAENGKDIFLTHEDLDNFGTSINIDQSGQMTLELTPELEKVKKAAATAAADYFIQRRTRRGTKITALALAFATLYATSALATALGYE